MSALTLTVTGATGKTGRQVVAQAIDRGWTVRAASRRQPQKGDWARLDWDDEATWEPAFAGSDAAYLLIPFNHPGAAERTPAVIEAAARAGVSKIVLLTSLDAEHAPDSDPLRAAELTLPGLPVRWAILRPTWFLDNFTTGSFAGMTEAGELRLPAGEGRIPLIDVRDIAAVAVAALALEGPEGVLPLTGPEAVDHHEVAAALSEAYGRSIRYRPVGSEEFIGLLSQRGFSRDYGEFLAEALVAVADGRLRIPVEPTVRQVTDREPRSVWDFARAHAAGLVG